MATKIINMIASTEDPDSAARTLESQISNEQQLREIVQALAGRLGLRLLDANGAELALSKPTSDNPLIANAQRRAAAAAAQQQQVPGRSGNPLIDDARRRARQETS